MAPFLILLLGAGCLSLLRSERFDRLDPVRARWAAFEPRARQYVRSAPATFMYLFVLLVTTWVLQNSSTRLGNRLLLEQSTNIHELSRQPVRVVVASAFFVPDIWEFFSWVILFVLFVAPLEHRIGSARSAGVFVFGHVGSTVLTAIGLCNDTHNGHCCSSKLLAGQTLSSRLWPATIARPITRQARCPAHCRSESAIMQIGRAHV